MNQYKECIRILESLENIPEDREEDVQEEIYNSLYSVFQFADQEKEKSSETAESELERISEVFGVVDDVNEPLSLSSEVRGEGMLGKAVEREYESRVEQEACRKAIDRFHNSNSLKGFIGSMKRGLEIDRAYFKELEKVAADPEYEPEGVTQEEIEVFRNRTPEEVRELENDYEIAIQAALTPVAKQYE